MTQNQKIRTGGIGLIFLLSVLIILPTFLREHLPSWWYPQSKMKLGLDLRGGTYFVLEVQTAEAVKSQLASIGLAVRSDLRGKNIGILRAKQTGTRSLALSLLNDRKLDELETYMRSNYPQLTKRELVRDQERVQIAYDLSEKDAAEIEKNAVTQAIETIRNRVDQYGVTEPSIQRMHEKRILLQLPDVKDVENVKKSIGKIAKLEFRVVADNRTKPDTPTVQLPTHSGGKITLEDEVLMTGDAVSSASVEISPQSNEVEVLLRLTTVGAQTFDSITSENVGRQLAIILDGVSRSAPVIRDRISGGTAQITGGFSLEEARNLAIVLRSGALPAPLVISEGRTVGASLGADSIRRGIIASLVGSGVVVLFMILYYGKSGVLAVGCVVINLAMLLASLVLFEATLTLPGIAGLALTVGMAIDNNVIIFERIREELRAGIVSRLAIETGFLRAHWTILDANLTTLISGIILYLFGAGPIKGFAVTLSLGILISMFTALVVSRIGFEVLKLEDAKGKLSI